MRIDIAPPRQWSFSTLYPLLIGDINAGNHLAAERMLPIAIEAQMRLFRRLGFIGALRSDRLAGVRYVMADAGLQFRREARYGDTLEVRVGVGELGRVSVDLIHELRVVRVDDEPVLPVSIALVKTALVFLDADSGATTEVPEAFQAALAGLSS